VSFAVKLDENLGLAHAKQFRDAGYDCDRATEEGLSGVDDDRVWQRVIAERRFFVTLDLDFSDIRDHKPGEHPGLLLIRGAGNDGDAVARIIARVLASHDLRELAGCLVVADSEKTRIRRPSEGG